ncbi:MAG TPA: sulfate adenylyltransferase, partial [Actinomycetota bacterium]|nr:sulfate adenylyltransferase [Actinomycetota bacterium]
MSDHETIPPHGGTLVDLVATDADAERLAQEAANHPKVGVNVRELSDLEMLAVGALSPLTGFVGEKDYHSILETMHLENGLPWTIPVTLSLTEDEVKRVGGAEAVTLANQDDEPVAVLEVAEVFRRNRPKEALAVFGTEDEAHPGVKALTEAGDWCLAGDVRVFRLPEHGDFSGYRMTPAETRAEFAKRGWRTVVGFQTRNPIHRAHEYIQKCALEIVDGL